MLRGSFTSRSTGRRVIVAGVTAENLRKIQEGKPIFVPIESFGIEVGMDLLIFFGEDEKALLQMLEEAEAPSFEG